MDQGGRGVPGPTWGIWQADAKCHVDNYTFVKKKQETEFQNGGRLFSEAESSFISADKT